MAAAAAVLDVLESEHLPANAEATGAYLKAGLTSLARDNPALAEVRGAGLYLGVDVTDAGGAPSGERAAAIVNGMRDRCVLISATGSFGHTLKIRPPLPFSGTHADHFLSVLSDVLLGPGPNAAHHGLG